MAIEPWSRIRHNRLVLHGAFATFAGLIRLPFQHEELIWGIVPLYLSWAANELTSAKVSFGTAIQTGLALLWSGAHWAWQAFHEHPGKVIHLLDATGAAAVNAAVTLGVLILGGTALWSGLRRRYPKGMSFLRHTRFSAYFMIAIFPLQAGYLAWNWEYVEVIILFAIPIWLVLHFALMPLRR